MASILIKNPKHTGSYYFSYKGTFNVVLLGLVDADYKFIYGNVECNGRISDGGVFRNESLSKALEENSLNIPAARSLPGGNEALSFAVVAGDAFPLKGYLIKPYPYRHPTPTGTYLQQQNSKILITSYHVPGNL